MSAEARNSTTEDLLKAVRHLQGLAAELSQVTELTPRPGVSSEIEHCLRVLQRGLPSGCADAGRAVARAGGDVLRRVETCSPYQPGGVFPFADQSLARVHEFFRERAGPSYVKEGLSDLRAALARLSLEVAGQGASPPWVLAVVGNNWALGRHGDAPAPLRYGRDDGTRSSLTVRRRGKTTRRSRWLLALALRSYGHSIDLPPLQDWVRVRDALREGSGGELGVDKSSGEARLVGSVLLVSSVAQVLEEAFPALPPGFAEDLRAGGVMVSASLGRT